jgi:hypothetical protein
VVNVLVGEAGEPQRLVEDGGGPFIDRTRSFG